MPNLRETVRSADKKPHDNKMRRLRHQRKYSHDQVDRGFQNNGQRTKLGAARLPNATSHPYDGNSRAGKR